MPSRSALLNLLTTTDLGTMATIRRDGRPQQSTIKYTYDTEREMLRVAVTEDRQKTHNLRRDPRGSIHVISDDGWAWTVLDGEFELSETARTTDDEVVEELVDLYRLILGEHPDWDEYRQSMVDQRRLVIRLPATHVYGQTH